MTDREFYQLESDLFDDYPLPLQGLNGPRHWRRVDRFGRLLASRVAADLEVVRRFAILHDCQRIRHGQDVEHGLRGAHRARQYCADELSVQQMELLWLACEGHERGLCSEDPTIGTCWDADRLDSDRHGTPPAPELMSTAYGRELAELALEDRLKLAGLLPFAQGTDSLLEGWRPPRPS